ncbi:MAG: hypothetical protein HFH86_04590 [Bacilli bacterium]|nr:hypothetical protein [Bacilli bacterium]
MGNVLTSIKRFLGNKNTVTIIGVIAGILVLYIGYTWRVKQATDPVQIPYAKNQLISRHEITLEDIGYMEVSREVVSKSKNLIQNASQLVGKQVQYGNMIPQNGFFYTEQITDAANTPDFAISNIPDGYTIIYLDVDINSTYGNSIYPGNYIDLYFKGFDENRKIIFGKLIESIEVLDVRDSEGQHVFETSVEARIPAVLVFAVPDDMFSLLKKANYISGNSVEIIPVPRNASYSANPGETRVSSAYIQDFILSQSVVIPEGAPNNTINSGNINNDNNNNNNTNE